MKKLCPSLLTLLILAVAAFSQSRPAARPTPTSDDSDVVKISTNLIQLDVTVTDAKGKAITDLRPDEIQVFENGQKQTLTNFSFVSNVRTAVPEQPKSTDKNAIPLPQAFLRPEQIRRTFALAVDDLSLSFESAYQTRRALKKFVDEQMHDGDLVAIVRTGAGIGALQQFTSDKGVLYAAIEKVKWNPLGSGGVGAFAPIEATLDTSLQTDPSATADATGGGQSLDDFRSSVFATGTLGALKYIVSGMGELPGRKSVILFSDGFKLFETNESGIKETGRVMDFLKQLIDQANRSSVVFYTVDARGLAYTGLAAADNPSDTSGPALSKNISDRNAQLTDTQEGLSYLAHETGGFAVKNNNDLSGGVKRVLDDQSYYLVAYQPESDTFDATKRRFNKLEVKVSRKGANVRYRSGFFNVANRAEKAPTTLSPVQQLEKALVSPFAVSGIDLHLNALFGTDATTGAFVRSLLHVNPSGIKFSDEKDGGKRAVFEALAISFGDNGQPIEQLAKTYTLTLQPGAYKRVMADGFVYNFVFPVKRPGAYQFRVAIRDVQGGNIGSASQFIEVPDLKKDRLVISGIILETFSAEQWTKFTGPESIAVSTNPMADTALRRVRMGSVLRYGFEVYNAGLDQAKRPHFTTKVRVFSEGKLVLDGARVPFEPGGQTDMAHLRSAGAIKIGEKMAPGDYVLQVIAVDAISKKKPVTQTVQFEVVP